MTDLIQLRGDTAANWTLANPILAARELVLETDTRRLKMGDGATHYNDLLYVGPRDARWSLPPGEVSVDEFDNDNLDASWVRVDGAGAAVGNMTVRERNDSLSITNLGGDTADVLHGLVRPLAGIGGALAAGDGFVTNINKLVVPTGANWAISGLVLTDSAAHGAGKQVCASHIFGAGLNYNLETYHNWNVRDTTSTLVNLGVTPYFLRLAMIAANTWRADLSPNGIDWFSSATVVSAFVPTHVGFFSTSWGTAIKHIANYEFIRRVNGVV